MDLYETLKASLGDEYRVRLKDGNIIVSDTSKKDFYMSIPADYKGSSIDVAYMYPGDFIQGQKRDIDFSGMANAVGNVRATNPDAIIIHSASAMDSFKLVNITDKIMEVTGMDYNNVAFEGHSAGCYGVTRAAGRYARRHPNNAAPTLIMADGYYSVSPSSVKSKDIKSLNAMGATIIELSVYGKTPKSHGLERFIGNGATVLYFDPKSKSKSGGHGSTYKHAFGTDLIGLALGNGGNFDGYDIKYTLDIYDPDTGKLVEKNVNPEEALKYFMTNPHLKSKAYIQSLEYISKANFDDFKERTANLIALKDSIASKLGNIDVSSDKKLVLESMNNIVNLVSSTKMLGGSGGCGTSGSTTRVPICAIDYVHTYRRMLTTVLEKISNEAVDAIGVAFDIDTSDLKLKTVVDTFDDIIIPEETPTTGNQNSKNKDDKKANGKNNKNSGGKDKVHGSGSGHNGVPFSGTGQQKSRSDGSSFPNYDSIHTNDNQIVYEVDTGCKAVFGYDNNQNVTNMEYYYDFQDEATATKMLAELNQKYSQVEGFESITQNGQYLRVNFTKDFYQKLTVDDIARQYNGIERI